MDNDAGSSTPGRETFLLLPGTYTITEDAVVTSGLGWDLKSLVCNGTAFNGSTATITLVLRESVTCIFTNQMRGNIEIITDSIPDDRQDFEYPVSGGSLTGSFTLDDDTGAAGEGIDYLDIQQFDDIPAGSYTVSEIVPRGWDLTNLTCSDPDGETTTSVDGEAIIDLDPGETVTCTFENTKSGTITIENITEGGDGTFTFTGDAIGTQTITTEGEPGQATVTDLPANQSYTATEAVHPSFDLTNITCLDSDDSGTPSSEDPDSRTATFALDPGETVKCTFTNIKRGTIVIEKQTIGGDDSFDFTGDLGAKSIVTNNNVGELRLENVVANQSYIVNESDPTPMFDLTDIVCEDGDPSGVASSVDIGGRAAHFQVDPGETVKCTFINTKRGTIIVEKRTIGGDGNFTFTGDVAGTISPGQPIVVANVVPNATYTSTEADPSPDFVLTDLTCDDAGSTLPSSWDINTRTATFEVDPGETVTCTFTNTKRGTLTIVQDSLPIDPQNFEFYFLGGGRSSTFFLDDDSTLRGGGKNELPDTEIFSGLAPGTPFSISQATVMVPDPRDPTVQVPAWDLTDITCVGGTGFSYLGASGTDTSVFEPGDDTAVVTLGPGGAVVCTFSNTKRGRIIIDKATNPPGSPQTFDFSLSGNGYSHDFLLHNGDDPFDTGSILVPSGEMYSATQASVEGWDANVPTCNSELGTSSFATGPNSAHISLGAGDAVTCIFNNIEYGHIVVNKTTMGGDATFGFNLTGGPDELSETFYLANDGTYNTGPFGVKSGNYRIFEILPESGWNLTALQCLDSSGSSVGQADVLAGTMDFHLDPAETVTCDFENTKWSSITVIKDAIPNDPQDFQFETGNRPPRQKLVDTGRAIPFFQLDDDNGAGNQLSNSIVFPNLVPGTFNITEVDPGAGWDLTGVVCVGQRGNTYESDLPTVSIELAVGDDVVCTYTNTKRGTILINKATEPAGSSDSFGFDGGTLGSLGPITDGGTIPVTNLVPGQYTVTENGPIYTTSEFGLVPDYLLTSITCQDEVQVGADATVSVGDITVRTASINLDPGETVECTFTNTKPGTITVIKNTDPDPDPYGTDFEFNLKNGEALFPADVSFSLLGGETITVVGLYPASYSITEGAPEWPWVLDSLVCVSSDGSTVEFTGGKADVELAADGNVTCTFTNKIQIHPGSHGFWKNWHNENNSANSKYSLEVFQLFLKYLEDNNPQVYTGIATGSGPVTIAAIFNFGNGGPNQALLAELTALKLDLAASHLELTKEPGDTTEYLKHDYISLGCKVDLSRTDLVAVAGVAEAEGYAFIYDFFSAPATHEILVGDVVDGIEGAWTGVSPITSNLEDWSFALFDDPGVPTTGLTADQKKALLYQVLYGIIHGVNLPYMDGSPCFPPVITTDKTLSPGAEKQFYSATLSPIGGVPPYQWEAILTSELPPALVLHSDTGVIDGYPTLAGDYTFEVRLTDSLGRSHTKMFSINIHPMP